MSDSRPRTNEGILNALDRAIEEILAEREARKPPLLTEAPGQAMVLATPGDCPFPHTLLTERISYGIPLSDAEKVQCERASLLKATRIIQRATVTCTPVPVSLPPEVRPAYRVGYLGHAELLIASHRVHLEAITLELSSPGGINEEVRIYVDGVLEGRGILFGRLGAGGDSFPAIAAVGPHLRVSVAPVGGRQEGELIVELSRRASPEQRVSALLTAYPRRSR